MRNILWVVWAALILEPSAYAMTGSIIQVSRPVHLSSRQPKAQKQYFIDVGERHGIRQGATLEVYRVIPVLNEMTGSAGPVHRLRIGDLRVVSVSESVAVGEVEQYRAPNELAGAEYLSFMLGDEVQMKRGLPIEAPRF